jgi:hypothetical protein
MISPFQLFVLKLYAGYLFANAVFYSYQMLTTCSRGDMPVAMLAPLMIAIHGHWNWQGADSGNELFFVASLASRLFTGAAFLLGPSLMTKGWSTDQGDIPKYALSTGYFELGWAALFVLALLRRAIMRDGGDASRHLFTDHRLQRDHSRVVVGFAMVFGALYALFYTEETESLVQYVLPNFELEPAFVLTHAADGAAAAPVLDWGASAWFYFLVLTVTLGWANMVAGTMGVRRLLNAGREGGFVFAAAVVALVIFYDAPLRLLLIPLIDLVVIAYSAYREVRASGVPTRAKSTKPHKRK